MLFLRQLLREEVGEGWTEFLYHRGLPSPDYASVYFAERETEVRTLTDPRIRETAKELSSRFALCHHKAI